MRTRLNSGLLASALVAATWGCGSGESATSPSGPPPVSAPAPAPAVNYDGSWQGTTSEGTNVRVTVQGNSITGFRITFNFGSGACPVTADVNPQAAVSNGAFNFRLSQGGVTSDISGNFSSATAASGTYGQVNVANVRCDTGGTVNGFKSGGQFTATRS